MNIMTTEEPPDQPDLICVEESLMSFEKLDRASPDLWPEQTINEVPGVNEFVAQNSPQTEPSSWAAGLTPDDINQLHQGTIEHQIVQKEEEVKRKLGKKKKKWSNRKYKRSRVTRTENTTEQWCFRGRKGGDDIGETKVEQEGDSCQAGGKVKRPGEQTEIENVDGRGREQTRLLRDKLSTHSTGNVQTKGLNVHRIPVSVITLNEPHLYRCEFFDDN
ncbi:Protein lin-52 like protein [Eufriesea mexicana]|nr:Protein lin-52 like protein [Eufriesea mexicana]